MRYFKNKNLLAGFFLFFSLYGCKKVININLKNADIQTIITGEVNNHPGPYKVSISKSVNFSSDNIFPNVSGALVIIKGNGVTDTLSETSPGTYSTHTLTGSPGKNYELFVSVEGKIYTANSVMPQPVEIDSIGFMSTGNNNLFPVVFFQDPPGVDNYYQFIEYSNDKRFGNGRGNFVFDDRLSDGRYISRFLYGDDSTDIKPGIKLTVQMNCIDKPVYNYLSELLQISGSGRGGFSNPTPANPTSNITGGALGYFSANTINRKSVLMP